MVPLNQRYPLHGWDRHDTGRGTTYRCMGNQQDHQDNGSDRPSSLKLVRPVVTGYWKCDDRYGSQPLPCLTTGPKQFKSPPFLFLISVFFFWMKILVSNIQNHLFCAEQHPSSADLYINILYTLRITLQCIFLILFFSFLTHHAGQQGALALSYKPQSQTVLLGHEHGTHRHT